MAWAGFERLASVWCAVDEQPMTVDDWSMSPIEGLERPMLVCGNSRVEQRTGPSWPSTRTSSTATTATVDRDRPRRDYFCPRFRSFFLSSLRPLLHHCNTLQRPADSDRSPCSPLALQFSRGCLSLIPPLSLFRVQPSSRSNTPARRTPQRARHGGRPPAATP